MTPRIACVHTSTGTVGLISEQLAEVLPGVRVTHFIDDSVVQDVILAGRVDARATRRMCNLYLSAELSGASVALLCCSTVGETAEVGKQLVGIPIVRIDEEMAERAVSAGERVAVVATVDSTVEPSTNLILRKAQEAGRQVSVKVSLCDGALALLRSGQVAEHDQMVVETVRRTAREADVVVLAQASMVRVAPLLGDLGVPVFTSPRLGVERVKRILERNA